MLPAVVLAAGASSRMRSPKALLPDLDDLPFVVRIVSTLATAGVEDVIVVTGSEHEAIVATLRKHGVKAVRAIRNPEPARGQLSSLHVGMDAAIRDDVAGLMVTLVDVPLVNGSTVRSVMRAWQARGAGIVRPALGDRHGHPVIFDRRLFAALRDAPLDEGAKSVVRTHAAEIENVAVDDAGCLIDFDTPADYAQLSKAVKRASPPHPPY